MAPGMNKNVMHHALLHVMSIRSLWDKWICDETLYHEVNDKFPQLGNLGIDRRFMNKVISIQFRDSIEVFDANTTKDGSFRYSVTMEFPYSHSKRKICYYCITEPVNTPSSGRP